ncbi:MAG: hypothetical protein WCH61_04995 [bacterium]
MFISMTLAVMMPKLLIVKPKGDSNREKRIELQRMDLDSENAALRAKISELAGLAETYDRQLRALEADPRSRAQADLAQAQEKIAALTAQRDRLAAELQQQGKQAETKARQAVNARQVANELEAQVAELEKRAAAETAEIKRQFRLPQMRSTSKAPLFMAVKGGKLFYVMKADGGPSPQNFDARFMTWRQESANAWRFDVKPEAGLGLADAQACNRGLKPFSGGDFRREYYLEFWVFADSFPEFVRLKEQMCRWGISYNWDPKRDGDIMGLQVVDTPVQHEVQ